MISTVLLILAAVCFAVAAYEQGRNHQLRVGLVPAGLCLLAVALLV